MKKVTLLSFLVGVVMSISAFAVEIQSEVDLDTLVPADELSSEMQPNHEWGGYPGRWQSFRCFARNRRGMVFEGFGYHPREAEMRALDQCRRYSRYCVPAGCKKY